MALLPVRSLASRLIWACNIIRYGCIADWGEVFWSGIGGALAGAFAAATWGMAPVGFISANGLAGAGIGAGVAGAQGGNPWWGAGAGLAGGLFGAGVGKGIAAALGKVFGPVQWRGGELKFSPNFRVSPFGHGKPPTGVNPWPRRLPHYHRRGTPLPNGQTPPGQGIGNHRPYEGGW